MAVWIESRTRRRPAYEKVFRDLSTCPADTDTTILRFSPRASIVPGMDDRIQLKCAFPVRVPSRKSYLKMRDCGSFGVLFELADGGGRFDVRMLQCFVRLRLGAPTCAATPTAVFLRVRLWALMRPLSVERRQQLPESFTLRTSAQGLAR